MIIRFDRHRDLSIDQKLQSLATSVQLALNEIATEQAEIQKAIKDIQKKLEEEGD